MTTPIIEIKPLINQSIIVLISLSIKFKNYFLFSTTFISSAVNPYNLYTSSSIFLSALSISEKTNKNSILQQQLRLPLRFYQIQIRNPKFLYKTLSKRFIIVLIISADMINIKFHILRI